ncbi:MFS transporter [Parerythrobacter aestuarii]|uniref:MFS transporter n=1 Tax=Parerythrobacter aestuarii TaxID=3020909 RepID=UPI0024DE87A2|nr:MFS transporter [Parerythrobacter aestuarii]
MSEPRALPTVPLKGAGYALALVSLMQAISLLDRQILAILAPAIKADLGIGDAEMGMLYGTVFALFYALFSLPLGRIADGWIRTKLLAFCLTFWSAATALSGVATSFAMLATARLGVGIGEAATSPAGTSLVYDYWPKHRRGFVMSVMASAIALGLGGSLILGGVASQWWDENYAAGGAPLGLAGWQFAFLVASLPGFVLAVFMYFLREPERGGMDGIESPADPHPFRAGWQVMRAILPGTNWVNLKVQKAPPRAWRNNFIWVTVILIAMIGLYVVTSRLSPRPPLEFLGLSINPHALQWGVTGFGLFALVNFLQNMRLSDNQAFRVITGSPTLIMCMAVGSLQTVINYGMMAFNPSFLLTYYDLTLSEAALQFGFVSAGMGIIGPLIWGPLSDKLNIRFPGAGRAWVAMFAMGVSPLMSFWVYYAPTPGDFYLRFVFYSLVLTGWLPPLYAILYEQVLPRMRAVTSSTYLLASTILGLGIGPYVVGMLSDATGDLRTSMLAVNTAAVPIVLLLLFIAKRASKDEDALLERAAE